MTAFVFRCLMVVGWFASLACGGTVDGGPTNVAGDIDDLQLLPDDDAPADDVDQVDAPTDVDAPGDSDPGDPVVEAPQPLRLVLVYSSHGIDRDECFRDTGATTFAIGRALAPIAAFRDRMLVVDGVSGPAEGNGAHGWGAPHAFTASVEQVDFQGGDYYFRATGPSLDRVFAPGLAMVSMVTSHFQLPSSATVNMSAAADDNGNPIAPSPNPSTARDIASAFADDITRAAIYQVSHAGELFTIGNQTYSYNELAHAMSFDINYYNGLIAARSIIAQRVAILLETLASTTVGTNSNLLDNTLVVWVDDTGWGPPDNPHHPNAHGNRYLPLLVFTPSRLALAAPLYLQLERERPYADFLATIAEAVGLPDDVVGAPIITEAFKQP